MQLTSFGWVNVGGIGALCWMTELKDSAGKAFYERIRNDFLRESEIPLQTAKASGYGTALSKYSYGWGSILTVMGNAMAMILHFLLTGREDMRNAAMGQADYALGLNALDRCFVTGFGEKRVMYPHHRPSAADGIPEPVPGLISGGPNKNWTYGWTREKLGENVPPAKSYLDETPSADTNEIAIYWNSPAVFTFAFFNALCGETGGV